MTTSPTSTLDRELGLTRILDVPRRALYRCWTEPALLRPWFCPSPWTVPHAELDVRPGGTFRVVMRSPEGQEFSHPGVYLEVVPDERLVWTDAYVSAWQPSQKPFMTAIIAFEDAGPGKTKYTARALHWNAADREQHEKMGFHEGWGQATAQLEAFAKTL